MFIHFTICNSSLYSLIHSIFIFTLEEAIMVPILQMSKQFERLKIDLEKITELKILRSVSLDSMFSILYFPVTKKLNNTENFTVI